MPSAYRSVATGGSDTGSFSIAKPAGTIDGDVLIASFICADSNAVSVPAGWTSVFSISTVFNKRRQQMWKIAAGEPGSYAFGTASPSCAGIIVCLSGTTGVKDASANQNNVSSNTVTGPAFTTAKDNETIVWAGFRNAISSGSTDVNKPASLTQRGQVWAGADITDATVWVATGQFPTAGALTNAYKNGTTEEVTSNMAAIIAFIPAIPPSGSMFLGSP